MWIEVILIGIIIGLIRGGRLSNIGQVPTKGIILVAIGLLVQLIPFFLHRFDWVAKNATLFTIAGLLIALVAIALNLSQKGMWLILFGGFLQTLVLYFHKFKMPIRLDQITSAQFAQMKLGILSEQIKNYTLFSDSSHWSRYLGKLFIMPDFYPFTKYFGIPDILIAIGVIFIIQSEMQIITSYGRRRYYGKYRNY